VAVRSGWPAADDFAPPPDAPTRARWAAADAAARPGRLARLRERLASDGIDAYFGVRPEHSRWLTGFRLDEGEDKVAGHSGQFLVGAASLTVLADSRYTIQATEQATGAAIRDVGYDLPGSWSELLGAIGARRVAVEAAMPHALWQRLAAAAPDIELVPVEGWLESWRATKTLEEIERVAAACAVADRALATLLPEIRPGVSEVDLALRLEWLIRTGGAEALAFPVACLGGAQAALPHGAPGERPVAEGRVLLFDFGAQVEGYRSDMTRTLFVGEPTAAALDVYELVARAQQAVIDALAASISGDGAPITGRAADAAARDVIEAAGHGAHFGHGTGHGIGLATHEDPRLSRAAPETPLPSPTVFSVEPGVYLEGELGVRIEDLIHLDASRGLLERLTHFPREPLVVGV
jgi:Xaa-Pro aminopeptidase